MPLNPSDPEDEYFKKREVRKLREQSEITAREKAVEDRDKLKELHWMHCPKCGLDLVEVEYRGVQVDTCFQCGGMYLDKGEIEKIMGFEEPGALRRMVTAFFGTEDKK